MPVVVCRWTPAPEPIPNARRNPCRDRSLPRTLARPPAARLRIRRSDHRGRLHAVGWPGDRSHHGLLPSCRAGERLSRRPAERPYTRSPMSNPIATVEVPASSANLGSGFDCFAAALSLKLRAELFEGDEPGIVLNAHGEGTPGPDADPEADLLLPAFREG